jgi:aryl-alcohol dehydrogenase-like predicted oxidoreductase
MRSKHPHRPPTGTSSRRQIVRGFGALIGGVVTGCGHAEPSGTAASGGSSGSAGSGLGGTGSGGTGTGGTGTAGAGIGPNGGTGVGGSGGAGVMGKAASDRVTLGMTGIVVSRLAMGSGTHGSGGSSDQTRLGASFSNILTHGYSQGLTLFETADAYGAHRLMAEGIRQVGRQNVTVLTKTTAETAEGVEADLARFREELGVDMIDIVLLHNKQSGSWTTQCEGAMDALSRAKQSGAIRAHGVSCHTLQALELAAVTPWVDIDLARINPMGIAMDADPATVISVLTRMKAAGKGVIGMKILGEGRLANQLDMAIGHAVALDCIDAFTIGFTSTSELDQITQKIAAA